MKHNPFKGNLDDLRRSGDRWKPSKARTDTNANPKKKHKPFRVKWVKLPLRWAEALRQSKSVNTYRLAHTILFAAFKQDHCGGEIVLSSTVTGLPRHTKSRAVRELVELGLIEINQKNGKALRVSRIYYENKE
jgi:hypothetical protein